MKCKEYTKAINTASPARAHTNIRPGSIFGGQVTDSWDIRSFFIAEIKMC
jgi:hypothetical protein